MEVKLHALLDDYDRPTNRPIDQPTDILVHCKLYFQWVKENEAALSTFLTIQEIL